jgi:asparagine synthase (glutamine-hydrolysing)
MCGIAGVIRGTTGNVSASMLRSFLATLDHRGPDDQGVLVFAGGKIHEGRDVPDKNNLEVALVHRRLSIIDLSDQARQPMSTVDQRFHIVFNGELYNYLELRAQLKKEGVSFQTNSDTEVLLAAYVHWGVDCLEKFNGMFAFAILDCVKRELFLCRDFFGIKPLYYAFEGGNFLFASEMKALLNLPGFPREAEPDTLFRFLRWGPTYNAEKTMLRSIKQVMPGHYLIGRLDNPQEFTNKCYWNIDADHTSYISFNEASRKLRSLFDKSIELHMRSDVPVGSALSGGVDSSTIVMAMREHQPKAEIHTFSFCSPDYVKDESRWSSLIAAAAHTRHHQIILNPQELLDILEPITYSQDEPFAGTSVIAQYAVFRAAKQHGVTVMLDGQGADEMFAGYSYFRGLRLGALLAKGHFRKAWHLCVKSRQWPDHRVASSIFWAGSMFLPSKIGTVARLMTGKGFVHPWMNGEWFRSRAVNFSAGEQFAGCRTLKQCLRRDLTKGSIPDLLRFEDRNSMAHSIESRVPFLSPELAQFVFKLPEEYLVSDDGTTKSVLRAAYKDLLPEQILKRKDKVGFATPEAQWLIIFNKYYREHLTKADFNRISAVLSQNVRSGGLTRLSEQISDPRQLWRVLNLAHWAKRFDVNMEF